MEIFDINRERYEVDSDSRVGFINLTLASQRPEDCGGNSPKCRPAERSIMRRLSLTLVLLFLLLSPALAQFNVVPGGAIVPNHGLQYIVPAAVPFSYNPFPAEAYYDFGWRRTAPVSWLSYPFVPVPVTRDESVMVEIRRPDSADK